LVEGHLGILAKLELNITHERLAIFAYFHFERLV
jgi:hypothetical protein